MGSPYPNIFFFSLLLVYLLREAMSFVLRFCAFCVWLIAYVWWYLMSSSVPVFPMNEQ